jgi:hypothetical protein
MLIVHFAPKKKQKENLRLCPMKSGEKSLTSQGEKE